MLLFPTYFESVLVDSNENNKFLVETGVDAFDLFSYV